MQVVEEELINKQMKTLVEMGNSGVIYLLKNKIKGLFKSFSLALKNIDSGNSRNDRDLKQRERSFTSRTSKMATGSWYFLSFSALTRQIRTAGVKTKAFRFVLWDESVPSSQTSNFRLTQFQNYWHYFIIIWLLKIAKKLFLKTFKTF